MLSALIGPLLDGLFGLIDKSVEDRDQAAKIKADLQQMILNGDLHELDAAAKIIAAEATGESWLQRNWRPLLMLLFGVIVANNFLVAPLFGSPQALIPPDMWALLKLGLGGYVLGRSAEKSIRLWKSGP